MKAVKDFVKSKLVEVGFNKKNIFCFEPLDESQALKNLDSAYFYNESSDIESGKKGLGAWAEKETLKNIKQNITQKTVLNLKLFMTIETLHSRLDSFVEKLYSPTAQKSYILRIIDAKNKNTTIYDVKSAKKKIGKQISVTAAEVDLTLNIEHSIVYEEEEKAIDNIKITPIIKENENEQEKRK